MEILNKADGLMLKADNKIRTDKKTKIVLFSVLLALFVFAFAGSNVVSAASVNVTGGALGDFYNVMVGYIYGTPGVIIAIFIFLFGVIMMISKHFFIMIMAIVAIVLFFLAPDIVLGLANTGAALSGAII